MPDYINRSTGQKVSASVALDNLGRLRAGFQAIVSNGEALGFSVTMCDSIPAGTVAFLTDAEEDRAIAAEVKRQRDLHDQKFAFLGTRKPLFDAGSAALAARAKLSGASSIVSLARETRHLPPSIGNRSAVLADTVADAASRQTSAPALTNQLRYARYS